MRIDGVAFAYHRGVPVVQDVSTALHAGAVHFVLGPNGVGKSTLLRLMLGQLRPGAGRVTIDGGSTHRMNARRLAGRVAYVPQRAHVAFAYTVAEVVAMGRHAVGRDPEAIGRAIRLCDLVDLADRPYVELSVGQQQRAMVARAVAQMTGVDGGAVLLDEPTSAMDLAHVHRTMDALVSLAHRDGLAMLIVSQDINLAARYADRVWLMRDGRVVADDTWDRVLETGRLGEVYGVNIRSVRHEDAESRPLFEVTNASRGD